MVTVTRQAGAWLAVIPGHREAMSPESIATMVHHDQDRSSIVRNNQGLWLWTPGSRVPRVPE
jgi:hypothetical protein